MPDFFAPVSESASQYSPVALLGFMTFSMLLALVLIALCARVVRALAAAKAYNEAVDKVNLIEKQVDEMIEASKAQQQAYDDQINQMRESHAKEIFVLQQTIFERNSEIIDLKTDLLELSKNAGNYHYDTLTQ